MDTVDRDERLAALAGRIAAVQSRPDGVTGSAARSAADDAGGAPSAAGGSPRGAGSDPRSPGAGSPADQTALAKAICLRLLAVTPRPRAGLAQALRRKEIPDDIAESVLDRLTEVGLIDDVAYAQSFVRTKQRDRALGRAALRSELRRLGVEEDVTAQAVDSVDTQAERIRAAELIAKRVDAAMASGVVAAKRRLLGLLARRGYSPEVAIAVVEKALEAYSRGLET